MALLPTNNTEVGSCIQRERKSLFAALAMDVAERAAFLQHDCHMLEADAVAQAIAEVLDQANPSRQDLPGILGELIAAGRRRHDGALVPLLQDLGLHGTRAPVWGFAHIVTEGSYYRPALPDEPAEAAIIAPAMEGGQLIDLAAQPVGRATLHSRLGVAKVLGIEAIEEAREYDKPVFVFQAIDAWLRGHCSGAVIIDLRQAAHLLDGIKSIFCCAAIAPALHRATSRCWPRPTIATPGSRDLAA